MAQETAVDFLLEKMSNLGVIYAEGNVLKELNDSIKKAIAMEKEHIKDAVIYGLDEDGHTGDWKISVAQNYYNKTFTDGNSGAKAD